jgi:hypothetical protein
MIVKKFGDGGFVNAVDAQSPLTNPMREMGNAARAIAKCGRSVATLGQVLLVSVNVWREWPGSKPVDAG